MSIGKYTVNGAALLNRAKATKDCHDIYTFWCTYPDLEFGLVVGLINGDLFAEFIDGQLYLHFNDPADPEPGVPVDIIDDRGTLQ